MNVSLRIGPALGTLVCVLAMGLSATASPKDDDKPKTEEPKTEAKKEAPKKPPIYDVTADARVQLDKAVAKAKRDNSRVLVMFGFEGCSWCHKLHALFRENAEVRKILSNEFILVMVDTGSPHANELIKECKASLSKDDLEKGVGYPFLAVFGSDGKIVTAQRTEPLEEGKGHDPDRVKEFLTHNAVRSFRLNADSTDRLNTQPQAEGDEWKRPAGIRENISIERCIAGGNSKQQYFLMRQGKPAKPVDKYGLVVIVPGGPGTADFLPFGANVLTGIAIPDDFLVAQLVAPQWRTGDDRIVWPSCVFPDQKADFTTEAFLTAVIDEVGKKHSIDERFVFTLGWSSSGHALYSASTRVPKIRGSIIAMSRFLPDRTVETDKLKGKAYYLYHSPDDTQCPFAEATLAAKTLKEHGAEVKLVSYKGGHGWQVPITSYCDPIREGLLWLKNLNTATTEPK